ncbi:MAG: restriction endonuclease subunit S [Limnoraphis robusta]
MIKPVLIGDILHRIKRPIHLDPASRYKLVTVKIYHKGVVLREEKLGADIKSKMYQIKEGDFILSGIDARNGAFGIVPPELDGAVVTNDFWYFEIDDEIVDKNFFLELTATPWFDDICRKGSDGTTQRIRLQKGKFFNQTIYLPDLTKQRILSKRFQAIKAINKALSSELTHQQILLKKLRQQILQEAIEGKLTADWRSQNPDIEPASELLKRIAAEKAELIKAKKIKPQKPLPPITDEEKPFELPKGWGWCRTNDACSYIVDCPHSTPKFQSLGKYCIDTTCINMAGNILISKIRKVSSETFEERNHRLKPKPGDIIYSREGVVGQAVIIPEGWEVCLGQRVMLFRPFFEISPCFFRHVVTSKFFLDEMFSRHRGAGAKHVNMKDLRESWIPLPPLAEQKAIVAKVEKLLTLCDQLETQITQNQTHAEQLMQAVLKEAFNHNSESRG